MSLKLGALAPDFTLPTDGNASVTLSALRGNPVVLYFYPKDDTSGCTAQACQFRDLHPDFSKLDAVILGISKDSATSHDRFKKKYDLPFSLVSDSEGLACAAYGVWVEKSMYGKRYMGIERTTYLIDREGKIAKIWHNVKVPNHGAEVLQALKAL